MVIQKEFSKIYRKIDVSGLSQTLLKKRLQRRCLPENFAKFLGGLKFLGHPQTAGSGNSKVVRNVTHSKGTQNILCASSGKNICFSGNLQNE